MEKYLDELIGSVLEYNSIPEDVKKQTEWVIGDTVIATLYGLKTEKGITRYLENAAATVGETGSQRYPVLGTSLMTNVKDNLIIHGTSVVSNELDEGNTFAKGHPSAHILPSLLVSAYQNNVDTDEVINTYVKAYEISSRLSYASNMRDDLHPHGTWGNVGGAVARALIERKTTEEIKNIILLSLSLPLSTSWMAAETGQSVRNLYTGLGSFLAYESVNLSEYGFSSSFEVVENVWENILGNGNELKPEKLTKSLLNPPLINQNYMKVYPACRFTHAAIDAAKTLINEYTIHPEEIDEINVDTYALAARCDVKHPNTKLQSKFSIPYVVACTILGVDMFADYKDNLPKVDKLSNNINVNDSPEMTNLLPNQRAAKVEIVFNDGRKLTHTVYNAQGEYSDRFNEKQLWEKYENMLSDHYSDEFLDVLKENLLQIRNYSTFREWLSANSLMKE